MKNSFLFSVLLSVTAFQLAAQSESPFVNFDQYEALVKEVKEHRKTRLLSTSDFVAMSAQEGVYMLDTRSKEMYDRIHIKGAIHLNFSDFTQQNLDKLFSDRNATILIYCNNNFNEPIRINQLDPSAFASKVSLPASFSFDRVEESVDLNLNDPAIPQITLALNIPTYINLFGYGYKNVYELKDIVNTWDTVIEFEGTDVTAQ